MSQDRAFYYLRDMYHRQGDLEGDLGVQRFWGGFELYLLTYALTKQEVLPQLENSQPIEGEQVPPLEKTPT